MDVSAVRIQGKGKCREDVDNARSDVVIGCGLASHENVVSLNQMLGPPSSRYSGVVQKPTNISITKNVSSR